MMKKRILIGAVVLVFALIGAAVIVHFWFESDGVRTLGNDIHAELSGKCYIIDPETSEITDETSLYISGSSSYSDSSQFEGDLAVVGYQNTASGMIERTMGVEQGEQGYWLIYLLESCTHRETVDGITKDKEHMCDYQYIYYLKPGADDEAVVRIELLDGDPLYAVRADTQTDALQRYEAFANNHP